MKPWQVTDLSRTSVSPLNTLNDVLKAKTDKTDKCLVFGNKYLLSIMTETD